MQPKATNATNCLVLSPSASGVAGGGLGRAGIDEVALLMVFMNPQLREPFGHGLSVWARPKVLYLIATDRHLVTPLLGRAATAVRGDNF